MSHTIGEWLNETFGEGAENCVLGQYYVDVEFDRVSLASTEKTGALQCCCGGDAIVCFRFNRPRRCILLVRDDSKGERWDAAMRRSPNTAVARMGPRPHAVLELKQTA
jgi:hypothetical protein